ncbi:MAK10-like protein [Tanacetum coccineum]
MGDENPIRTLGDYSKPSHEGYRNTIELPVWSNMVPLRSDTIRLVQNGCSFYGLRERTRLRLFQFSLRDQASNWIERLPTGSITTWEDLTTRFLTQFFLQRRIAKLCNDILMFQQHHGEYLSEAWTQDPALYDNESWNDPRDFAKPVKAITLPHDVPMNKVTTSCEICSGPHDTQYCMEDPEQAFVEYASSRTDEAEGKWYTFKPEQNNLGDTYNPSWRSHPNLRWRQPQISQNNFLNLPNQFQPNGSIPNRSFNNHPQSFNNHSSLEGLASNFMASQDTRLSKFEDDFKRQQGEMTNKIDTVLKAITDRIAGALPTDTVKNPKLSISPVFSACSYLTDDPQCSSHPSTSINAIKAHSNEADISQASLLQTKMGIEPQQSEEPEPTLEDEFQDLHLNLPVLEVLAYAPIYNAILDKYVESLELGKIGSTFFQGEVPAKMEDPGLFTLPCRLGDSKPFDTLADLGSCVNIIPLYLFKKLNIGLLEETDHIFGLADRTKSYPVGIVKDVEVHIGKQKLLNNFYVIDINKDLETPLLVGRGFLATANVVIDCKMAKITVGEGITGSVFGVKGVDLGEEETPYWTTLRKRESYKPRPRSDGVGAQTPYYVRKDFLDGHLPGEWKIARDVELNPFKDTLVFRRMVDFLGAIPINLESNMWESESLIENPINWDKMPKNGDGAWHAKIRLIDPDGEEFTKTLQLIPTTRKISERESPREIIDLDHFYDT